MSGLDDVFKNPFPSITVHKGLFGLYANDVLIGAQAEMWSEEEFKEKLTDAHAYVRFLNKLNDTVVQEMCDVENQLKAKGIEN